MDTSSPLKIKIRGLEKRFGSKKVLEGIDLDVRAGESLVVIGGSGTGKSVLLKCILGLLKPDRGSVLLDGEELVGVREKTLREITGKISMLFQGSALFDSLSVWENIAFTLLNNDKMSRVKARGIAFEKLTAVGLKEAVADLSPSELSGGMQRRVALARAIVKKPEIIFFDEPTTGLDPIMANVINNLIVQCAKNLGATSVTITHDLSSARKIADHIAMIHQGKIIWAGTAQEIDSTDNPIVQQFIHGETEGPIGGI